MKLTYFIILDPDLEYCRALVNALKSYGVLQFEYVMYTDQKEAIAFVKENRECIILVHEDLYHEELEGMCNQLVILKENEGEVTANRNQILKYQSVASIWKWIQEQILNKNRGVSTISYETKIVVFFSYCDSTMNAVLAQYYIKKISQTKKVLVVDLQLLPCVENQATASLSDIIYELSTNKDVDMERLASRITCEDGIDYLASVTHYRDLFELGPEEVERLFLSLCKFQQYEEIVVITDFVYSFTLDLFQYCHQIILYNTSEKIVQQKFNGLCDMMLLDGHSEVKEKFHVITLSETFGAEKLQQIRSQLESQLR